MCLYAMKMHVCVSPLCHTPVFLDSMLSRHVEPVSTLCNTRNQMMALSGGLCMTSFSLPIRINSTLSTSRHDSALLPRAKFSSGECIIDYVRFMLSVASPSHSESLEPCLCIPLPLRWIVDCAGKVERFEHRHQHHLVLCRTDED